MLSASTLPPYALLRSLVQTMGPLYSNATLQGTSTRPLAFSGTVYKNPASAAIYLQLSQLYQLQDAISRNVFNVSAAGASLESVLLAVESRFRVGPFGAVGMLFVFARLMTVPRHCRQQHLHPRPSRRPGAHSLASYCIVIPVLLVLCFRLFACPVSSESTRARKALPGTTWPLAPPDRRAPWDCPDCWYAFGSWWSER